MRQAATYWPPASNDGFGARGAGPPEERACRWQNDAELFRDPEGREVASKAVVYVSAPVEVGGWLILGEYADPVPPAEALEVRQIGGSPDLRAVQELHKVYL